MYKEKGYTSHDVVAVVRKILSQYKASKTELKTELTETTKAKTTKGKETKTKTARIKTGHTGTLDPQAEGVLPICVGRATKLAGYLTAADKSYQAELILGMTTDTYDHTGQILTTAPIDAEALTSAAIKEAVDFFAGGYMQTPPIYSAIKVGGKKLYDLARAGKTAEIKPRWVEIKRIDVIIKPECNIWLDIDCGKGTYIRSLCADIGNKLGCGGCMGDLIRTKSGFFSIEESVKLSKLKNVFEGNNVSEDDTLTEGGTLSEYDTLTGENKDKLLENFLIPPEHAFPALRGVVSSFPKARNGNPIPRSHVHFKNETPKEGGHCWLWENEILLGLYINRNGMLRPEVVMYENH